MLRFVISLCGALLAAAPSAAESPTPTGVWLHPNKRIQVEIAPCGAQFCGKMIWFRLPNDAQGRPLVDFKNANPALRGRPLLGLAIVHGFRRTGDRTWGDGRIYNPDDGAEYNSVITMPPDGTLRVRAYVLMPLLGQTLVWTRVR
jgi:uncharacterized protein (DUF2147 family)